MHTWKGRKENLGVFSLYAKRYKSVYISVNNNTNLNLFKILSNYIIWDRLSQKTISRYCPFKKYKIFLYLNCIYIGIDALITLPAFDLYNFSNIFLKKILLYKLKRILSGIVQ
jgi:hypothetical protein